MNIKKLFICLFAFLLVFVFASCADIALQEEEEKVDPLREFFGEEVPDETEKENIFAALEEVEINTRFISDFKKIENAGKYSFNYQNNLFIVTMDPDSTVYSVRVGEDGEEVYLKGYESYRAEDYFVPKFMESHLIAFADNVMEMFTNGAEGYEFSDDWVFEREGNYYHAGVTARTESSAEDLAIYITCRYDEAENTIYMDYVTINGEIFSDFTENYERPERQKKSAE